MKIGIVSFQIYPIFNPTVKASFGGAELQLSIIAKKLLKIGYNIEIFTSDYGQPEEETIDNIKFINLGKLSPNIISQFRFIIVLIIKLLFSNCNVYIQRSAGVETGIVSVISHIMKRKFIYMTASTIDVDRKYQSLHKFRGLIYNLGLTLANKIVVQNTEQKNILKEKYNIKSTIIKNGFFIKEQKLPSIKNSLLWVGTSQNLKRPEIYLKIAQLFKEEKFIMIMPKNNLSVWDNIIKQSKNIKNITLIEQVPINKIQKYFNQAKLFFNTSDYEGFPNTFIQAGIGYTPIISLNINPDKYLSTYQCGFSFGGNYEKMIFKIKQLLSKTEEIERLGKNNYNYVKENHDINKNILKLTKLFK